MHINQQRSLSIISFASYRIRYQTLSTVIIVTGIEISISVAAMKWLLVRQEVGQWSGTGPEPGPKCTCMSITNVFPACWTTIQPSSVLSHSTLTYFHCLDTDLWFMLIHRHSSAFEKACTWTMLSDCLKSGRLVTILSNIISTVHRQWGHNKTLLLINLAWPLTPDNRNSSPESRVQVCPCQLLFPTQVATTQLFVVGSYSMQSTYHACRVWMWE